MALEYVGKGIRVNSANSAYIKTPLLKFLPPKKIRNLAKLHPIGRLGEPEEIANVDAFLVSDESSFIKCIYLLIYGCYSVQ